VGRKAIAVPLGVVVLAAIAWFAFRPTGLRVGSLRVVPPPPGECVGRVEATVVNGTWESVALGRLLVVQVGKEKGFPYSIYPLKGSGPEFATSGADAPFFGVDRTLEPRASCVLAARMVRVRSGAAAGFPIHGEIYADRDDAEAVTLRTLPVEIDPAAWPLPVTIDPESLDRALGGGHDLFIAVDSAALPGGGGFDLEIGTSGRARGGGWGRLAERANSKDRFRAAGMLTPAQKASLRAAVRAAPFAAYRTDPKHLGWEDGHPVRLFVAAGPAAFAASSQVEDFRAAGLEPLLEHFRVLLLDLPDAGSDR